MPCPATLQDEEEGNEGGLEMLMEAPPPREEKEKVRRQWAQHVVAHSTFSSLTHWPGGWGCAYHLCTFLQTHDVLSGCGSV